ncbi:MAG: EVE domain-containing protein, partial [Gemmataceae bacterium]|nr:EVE domain-containing protein [Gemmataceae bacterium]
MAFWIFKCSPAKYRLSDRLADPNPTVSWRVTRYHHEIGPDDTVFLGETGRNRGIRAVMRLDDSPRERPELETEQPYDIEPDTQTMWRVLGTLTHRDVKLSHATLREVPGLENLSVFHGWQQATNFPVTPEQGVILLRLVEEQAAAS